MKLERRYVVISLVVLLLILTLILLVLYRSINSNFSLFGQPGSTPLPTPQPIPVSTTALPQGVTDPGAHRNAGSVRIFVRTNCVTLALPSEARHGANIHQLSVVIVPARA